MNNVVIKVEDLSKQYRLGSVSTGTISHDLNRIWAKMRGKEDPYLKIGTRNDRTKKSDSDYVWALKDISFEVRQGEVLGIIGRNGAGKSTLLKILSQITRPTTGFVKMKGRVGSLLEVGTGFHQELTGRENIYINGAILGMKKWEIDKKLDEIIEFSGVERYIDTPVKRYSSGMMVRLGFSVAAHLEPEILIVDEVLAVGDAEFQKKCMGKMGDISKNDGRTILFVSHNLSAIRNLCHKGIYLESGRVKSYSSIEHILSDYLNDKKMLPEYAFAEKKYPSYLKSYIEKVVFLGSDGNPKSSFEMGEEIMIRLDIELLERFNSLDVNVRLDDIYGTGIAGWRTKEVDFEIKPENNKVQIFLKIKNLNVFNGIYTLDLNVSSGLEIIDRLSDMNLEILPSKVGSFNKVIQKTHNLIYTDCEWVVKQ